MLLLSVCLSREGWSGGDMTYRNGPAEVSCREPAQPRRGASVVPLFTGPQPSIGGRSTWAGIVEVVGQAFCPTARVHTVAVRGAGAVILTVVVVDLVVVIVGGDSGSCSPCGRGEKWTKKGKVSQGCWLRHLVRTGYPESWLTWCWRTGNTHEGWRTGRTHTRTHIYTAGYGDNGNLSDIGTRNCMHSGRHCVFCGLIHQTQPEVQLGDLFNTDNFSNCK